MYTTRMETIEMRTYNGHRLACSVIDAGKAIVIFCHGYRGSALGPQRYFVDVARQLAKEGISSIRFDQYGSGNSAGDFLESSFDDWMQSTRAIAEDYLAKGYRVALMGQSMGGAAAIGVAADMPALTALVAWVPDPNIEPFTPPESGILEEAGQRVRTRYWREAHNAKIADRLPKITIPTYIVQCSDDEYVSDENHQVIVDNARGNHFVEMFPGYKHSAWTYDQAQIIIGRTTRFLADQFKK